MPQEGSGSKKSRRPAPRLIGALALILVGAGALRGGSEERRFLCPLNGATFKASAPISWNIAGGRDSDGCVYSLEEGRLVPHATGALITCPRCLYTTELARFARSLSESEKTALRAGLTAVAKSIPRTGGRWRLEPRDRARLAEACEQVLGPAQRTADRSRFAAGLWLHAAWLERGRAIGQGGASNFRPQSLAAGLSAFNRLEAELRQRRRPGRDELELIEELRSEVEALRAPAPAEESAEDGFRRYRLEARLLRLERGLERLRGLARTRIDRAAAALVETEERSLKVRLVQAAIRLGLRSRREELLAELRAESLPPTLRSALDNLIGHVRAEEAALKVAQERLGSVEIKDLPLRFLEADLARRLGQDEPARKALAGLRPLMAGASPELKADFEAARRLLERPR